MLQRVRLALGIGLAMAVGETLAALSLASDDVAFFALQALAAFAVGALTALAPVPLRSLPAVPLVGIGLFHGARVLREGGGFGASDYALLGVHTVATTVVVWVVCGRASTTVWPRRARAIFAAAYIAQSLYAARFMIPATLADWHWKAAAMLLGITLAPLAAAWITARLCDAKLGRAPALIGLALIAALPVFGHRPWLWRTHRNLEPVEARANDARPDVILIVLDTTRADRMSVYGHARATTPRLEQFAATATLYEHAQSQGIWTLPGHASLFTGLYPGEHGADWLETHMNARRLPREVVTLAERFKLGGYRTGCIAANKAIFGADFGLTQGFDEAWAELGSTAQLWVPFVTSQLVHTLWGQRARQRIGALEQNQFAPAQEINRLALDWLARTRGAAPRFLFLNYMEAHGQLRRPPCSAPLFGQGEPFGEWDVPDADIAAALAGRADANPAHLERFRDWYDCQVACLDLHVGELLDLLRARGIFDESLIVITSDHGHMLGEHRAFKHQAEIWQGLIGVPLMIKLPGQTRGARCSEPTETADLAHCLPRWLDLPIGTDPPAWAGAVDPAPALDESGSADALAAAQAPCPLPGRSPAAISQAGRMGELAAKFPERYDTSWTAILDGAKKFVVLADGSRRVADLAADPSEVLRALTPEENARCDELLAAWRAGAIAPLELQPRSDEEERRRLRALRQQGYVGED